MEFPLAQTPLDLLPRHDLTLSIWLGSNFISLLNRSCVNLMFLCRKRYLTWSKKVPLSCTLFVVPGLLTRVLPDRVTPYPISYPDTHLDFYPRLCPIPYRSGYSTPYPSRYPSHTRACYTDFYPGSCPIPYLSRYLEPYPSRTWGCYPGLYPSPTQTRTQSG
jgi:hypothetical protein